MKRKANPADVSKPQLELPFGQQGAARDLSYYIGLCKVFAAYHKRWPTADSTREEFRAARLQEYDGQRIDRELRFPGPELEADPAYRELWERCLADGATDGVSLSALDPRYRTVLRESDIADLFDTIALPGRAGPGAVRYATGVPAHAHGELTLQLGETLRARALRRAGLDPDAPRVLANSFSVRVQATDALKAFIDRIGVRHPPAHERLADFYLLDASDQGRLYIKYQVLAGVRYAGRFDADRLARTLASIYAADPNLAALRDTTAPSKPAAPGTPAAPAPHSEEEFREQLAMLAPEGQSLRLPIQHLSRFADIRRALEKAGGLYSTSKQQFDFEEGVDPAVVVERLVNGGAT
ncbi:hypothetical protein [Massilia niastensis]|uniref:hypothetical protein n=1 Tax=Massilia niastensis TaxID=544911 RepID=UPI0003602AB7|nr:hypothetical protein [Massilia niastensis]